MSRYDWLLFLHLIGAFAAVGSVVVFAVLLAGGDRIAGPQLTFLGRRLWDVGGLLTLVFGVWLALDDPLDQGYGIGDAWVIGAFVLWAIAGATGVRIGLAFEGSQREGGPGEVAQGERVRPLYAVMTIAVLALLFVMIFKPGA